MSEKMNMQQTISELDRVASLLSKIESQKEVMSDLVEEKKRGDEKATEAFSRRLEKFKEQQAQQAASIFPRMPREKLTLPKPMPKKPNDVQNPSKEIIKATIVSVLAIVSIIMWVILTFTESESYGLIFLSIFGMLGFGGYWFYAIIPVRNLIKWMAEYEEWEEDCAAWEKQVDSTAAQTQTIFDDLQAFDQFYNQMLKKCNDLYEKEAQKTAQEREEARLEILERFHKSEATLNALLDELETVDVIHPDLFEHAALISKLLKTGRADTLKEAINLAMDETRKDNEEAARREEAYAQETLLRRQAEDARMHNEAMQRAAAEEARAMREHNAAMERAARDQARAAEESARAAAAANKLAQERARAEEEQARANERAASEKCGRCKNSLRCSYATKRNSLSCGAYQPR